MTQPCPICGGIGEHYGVCREVGLRMMALTRKVGASDLAGTLYEAQEITKLLPKPDAPKMLQKFCECDCSTFCPNGRRGTESRCSIMVTNPEFCPTTPTGDQS